MKISATEKGALITAIAMLGVALLSWNSANRSEQDAKLLRLLVTKYAGCGCKITFTPGEIQTVNSLRGTGPLKAIEQVLSDAALPVMVMPEGPINEGSPFSFTIMAPVEGRQKGQEHDLMRNHQRAVEPVFDK